MTPPIDIRYPRGRHRAGHGIRGRALAPASWLYAAAGRMARMAVRVRTGELHERDTTIVSIGNIEAGGNGKTPLAMHLLSGLVASDVPCAYVSRGYRSRSERAPGPTIMLPPGTATNGHPGVRFVWRNDSMAALATEIGDEGAMVAHALPDVTLAFGRDKNAALSVLAKVARPDVVVLDDAFQSWSVPRDIDIVLVDAEHPFGPGGLLPAGTLRERPHSLLRADVVLANGIADVASLDAVRASIERRAGRVRQFGGVLRPIRFTSDEGHPAPSDAVVVSGIARPQRLEADLLAAGVRVPVSLRYPDHHRFTPIDAAEIAAVVAICGATGIVTTEKDWVKLSRVIPGSVRVWIATLDVSVAGVDLLDVIKKKKPQTGSAASRS